MQMSIHLRRRAGRRQAHADAAFQRVPAISPTSVVEQRIDTVADLFEIIGPSVMNISVIPYSGR